MTRQAPTRRADSGRAKARKLNQGLRHELRKFPRAAVEKYIRHVGATLGQVRTVREFSDVCEWRANLVRLDEARAALAAELAKFPMAAPLPSRVEDFDNPAAFDFPADEHFYRAAHAARGAVTELRAQIARSLKRTPSRRHGRPEADAEGVLADLARRYLETFGERPRSTPGGTFANVATLVLENLHGTAPRDVSRQMKAALKSL